MEILPPYPLQKSTDKPRNIQNYNGRDTFNTTIGQHTHNDRGTDNRDNKMHRSIPKSSWS